MPSDSRRLLLVSCRHCLRPITLASEIDDRELAALRDHLRGCGSTDEVAPPDDDELLHHFDMMTAF